METDFTHVNIEDMSPNDLSNLIIYILRKSERALTARRTTEETLHKMNGIKPESNQVNDSVWAVQNTLLDLARTLRVRVEKDAKGNTTYEPVHRTAEVETKIYMITQYLGGRQPSVVGEGPDPEVTFTAPLSIFVRCLFPETEK